MVSAWQERSNTPLHQLLEVPTGLSQGMAGYRAALSLSGTNLHQDKSLVRDNDKEAQSGATLPTSKPQPAEEQLETDRCCTPHHSTSGATPLPEGFQVPFAGGRVR